MSNYETQNHESIDPRDERALIECMSVLPDGADLYCVVSQSGSEYTVDTIDERCTCADATYRDVRCKHLRRVAFATGARAIPEMIDSDDVDEQLGEHVDVDVMTDGGDVACETDDADDGRPDDCDCGDIIRIGGRETLPCWPCYRDGFETPAPVDDDE